MRLTFADGSETVVSPLWLAPRSIFAIVVAELPAQPQDQSFVDPLEPTGESVAACQG